MKMSKMVVAPQLVDEARSMLSAGATLEDVLRFGAGKGLEKPYCLLLLHEASTLPFEQLKEQVHCSPVFEYRKAMDEEFEDHIVDTLKTHFGAVEDEHAAIRLRRELLPKAS